MRKITSLSLLLSFLLISFSGVILYLCPYGRVAFWHNWTVLGLSIFQYRQLHITSMMTFLFFACLHIYYNRRPILHYLRNKKKQFSFTKKEILITLTIHVFLISGTLYNIQPFEGFLDLGSYLRRSWGEKLGMPPYGRAERSTLRQLCYRMNINLENAMNNLKTDNVIYDSQQTLFQISERNHMSPGKVYNIIIGR